MHKLLRISTLAVISLSCLFGTHSYAQSWDRGSPENKAKIARLAKHVGYGTTALVGSLSYLFAKTGYANVTAEQGLAIGASALACDYAGTYIFDSEKFMTVNSGDYSRNAAYGYTAAEAALPLGAAAVCGVLVRSLFYQHADEIRMNNATRSMRTAGDNVPGSARKLLQQRFSNVAQDLYFMTDTAENTMDDIQRNVENLNQLLQDQLFCKTTVYFTNDCNTYLVVPQRNIRILTAKKNINRLVPLLNDQLNAVRRTQINLRDQYNNFNTILR